MTISIVLCTAPTEESARHIAHELIRVGLAACVNVLPNITSVYRWEGKVEQDQEVQMIIKTAAQQVDRAYELVCGLHPYDVPEWIILDASASDNYRAWMHDVTKITKEHS